MRMPVVDQSACISCGLCIEIAPNTFQFNDENVSEVINPQGDSEELIQQAIDSCPVSCITWEEA